MLIVCLMDVARWSKFILVETRYNEQIQQLLKTFHKKYKHFSNKFKTKIVIGKHHIMVYRGLGSAWPVLTLKKIKKILIY